MKKLISFVMATVLCLGMTTAVMATPSAETGTVSPSTSVEANASFNGSVVNLTESKTESTAAEQVEAMKAEGFNVASNAYVGSVKLELPAGITNADVAAAGGMIVRISDPYMSANMTNVVAVTKPSGSNTWESCTVVGWGNGYIDLKIMHFSEFAWAATPAATQPTQPTTPVAPKTADVAMFGMVAMAALAGTVTAARKAKESK